MDKDIIIYDTIILGSGPAGLTSAIYTARAGLKTLVVGGRVVGGQAALTNAVENYPGFIEPKNGFELTFDMSEQAKRSGAEIIYEAAVSTVLSDEVKKITLENGKELHAKTVIIATGANNRPLGLPEEKDFIGRGVSYCATCDGNFFRRKRVTVVGGGDTAVTDAIYLSRIASEVYLIHRRQGFRAAAVLVNRMKEAGVKLLLDSTVIALNGAEKLESVTVKNVVSGEEFVHATDGLFVAVGTVSNSELFKNEVETDKNGCILTDFEMKTNVKGVFCAGDVRLTPLRQIVTAAADGAIAAQSAVSYLTKI